ncbi:MAG: hypothetical protein CL693_14285 [Cellvibrionaceae bacterium]|nr:hypothetical protein [Cellvibrionaceae bacterium]|tara:strand:+ start:18382 stop:19551 length:1170 start_codon:yes stop_codon:yes gene_type:complete
MPFSTVQALLRSPLFIISITTLICLLLSTSLLQQQHHQRLDLRTDHYGDALASLAAKQATDATLNHDLVSLQVTVSDVARNPHVLSTTIHDVENNLLVQAGDSPNTGDYQQTEHHSYTAAITLHDSVAGYVTVTIDSRALYQQQDDTWLLALLGMAAALLVLSVLNARQQNDQPVSDKQESAPSAPSEADTEIRHSGQKPIIIHLSYRCLNWPTLTRQLSRTLKQQLFEELEGHLSGINALYSGKISLAQEDSIELQFTGDDIGNTTFRAICASQLFFNLLQKGCASIELQYSAAIYRSDRAQSLKQHIHNHRRLQQLQMTLDKQANHSLLLDGQDCATSQLLQRVQVKTDLVDEHWFAVEGLQPSYQTLLDKQAQQLNSQREETELTP